MEARSRDLSDTTPGLLLGTVAYMSPEQIDGQPVDARTDVFAFGIVLYELLTRQHPFRRDTLAATLSAILHDTPPSPAALNDAVPLAASHVVCRCLEKSRDDRYAEAQELADALAALTDARTTDRGRAARRRPQPVSRAAIVHRAGCARIRRP